MLPVMNIMFDLSVKIMKLTENIYGSFTENITPTWKSCKLLLDLRYILNNIDSLKLMVNTIVFQLQRLK